MTVIIGKGEKTALELLKEIYGEDVEYKTQVRFKDLMSYEFSEELSERQQKETVDIVMFHLFNPVCVRVQGGDHTGILKSARDTVQKQMLESGKLGRKSGEGFYDYSDGPRNKKVAKQFKSKN